MGEKRVVFPLYLLDEPKFSKKFWSMADQLITSISSYFEAGNDVPVMVGTDSFEVKRLVSEVSRVRKYPVEVVMATPSEIHGLASRYAEPICRNRIHECRIDVVTSKIYAMLRLGVEYDRLIADVDTVWFGRIPWDKFESDRMAMFIPPQWKHPLSITVGQILYYRSRYMSKISLEEYAGKLVHMDQSLKFLLDWSDDPWPNSGIVYMTSDFSQDRYANELGNPALSLLSVEDETPLVSLLGKGGTLHADIQMNVPVAFTDISMEPDILHPDGIICAHYHRSPKPVSFDITYGGVMRHPALHEPYSLDYLHDSLGCGQYGSMSGILWCYVWRYFYSLSCKLYRNGNDAPVYDCAFWKGIIEGYYKSRQIWMDSVDAQRQLRGMTI